MIILATSIAITLDFNNNMILGTIIRAPLGETLWSSVEIIKKEKAYNCLITV